MKTKGPISGKKFRHVLNKRSPTALKIAQCVQRDGYYYFQATQKRRVTSWVESGDDVVLEGLIISPM